MTPQRDNLAEAQVEALVLGATLNSTQEEVLSEGDSVALALEALESPEPVLEERHETNGTYTNGNGHHANGTTHGLNGHGHNGAHATALLPIEINGNGKAHLNGNGVAHVNGNGTIHRNGHATAVADSMPAALPVSLPWLKDSETDPGSYYLRFGKRALDLVVSGASLVVAAPVLLLFALLIKIDSRGPVLYKSTRLGRNGRPFTFYKLRSMSVGAHERRNQVAHLNAADGPIFKIPCDPRTTRVGRFIRQTSIDELPQLLNVIRGDMTLVGPRPPLPEEVDKYESWHRRRLEVKPGLTCLWQISGRSRLGFNEWMRLDLEYIRRQSFATDLKILVRTVPAVLSREGAY